MHLRSGLNTLEAFILLTDYQGLVIRMDEHRYKPGEIIL